MKISPARTAAFDILIRIENDNAFLTGIRVLAGTHGRWSFWNLCPPISSSRALKGAGSRRASPECPPDKGAADAQGRLSRRIEARSRAPETVSGALRRS